MGEEIGEDGVYKGLLPGMTPEQAIAYDIPRTWANGIQVTPTPDVTFIVFREQIGAVGDLVIGETRVMMRNVGSVVLPTPVAKQLGQLLLSQISLVEEPAPEQSGDDTAA